MTKDVYDPASYSFPPLKTAWNGINACRAAKYLFHDILRVLGKIVLTEITVIRNSNVLLSRRVEFNSHLCMIKCFYHK